MLFVSLLPNISFSETLRWLHLLVAAINLILFPISNFDSNHYGLITTLLSISFFLFIYLFDFHSIHIILSTYHKPTTLFDLTVQSNFAKATQFDHLSPLCSNWTHKHLVKSRYIHKSSSASVHIFLLEFPFSLYAINPILYILSLYNSCIFRSRPYAMYCLIIHVLLYLVQTPSNILIFFIYSPVRCVDFSFFFLTSNKSDYNKEVLKKICDKVHMKCTSRTLMNKKGERQQKINSLS